MEAPALPDDALAAVLRRLPTRTVASCRCVCKAWRSVVDDRGLLLPRALHGIFLNLVDYRCPRFFARPSSERPRIFGNLDFLPGYSDSYGSILDHCNGLLLVFTGKLYVVNPATRRWDCVLLPRMDLFRTRDLLHYAVAYLVFDPAISPHYEVFLIPRVPEKPKPVSIKDARYDPPSSVSMCALFSLSDDESVGSEPEDPYRLIKWPPSPYTLSVFSSCTGLWEERSFVREGEAVGTVENARLDSRLPFLGPRWRYGVYWQGALYVHCSSTYVIRLSLTNGTYQVIKTPTNTKDIYDTQFHLGRSEKGVYYVIIENGSQLQIWILHESHGQMAWVLKHHHIDLGPYVSRITGRSNYHELNDGPWTLEDGDIFFEPTEDEDCDNDAEMLENGDYEWDSDEDINLDGEVDEEPHIHNIAFLGFHPYKEIIFLRTSFIAIAYHLATSKVQYLGKLWPEDYKFSVSEVHMNHFRIPPA